ncbi:hypothetical protein SOM11_08330 [Frigoribacterium sp. CFBP9039]|uniref:hypothetical protein n=1 Tax=Frigoribacterium sp. CFBP9029 TaxID=3096541 RepID=UPI002A6A8591|nr:hypothetical protein [Frigoribacterium sp. CFBP9039]MDY0945989.1 hypothetical protein [Frigoribacterium sp. CFBP9039]
MEKIRLGCKTSHTKASIPTLTRRLMPYMMRPNRESRFTLDVYPMKVLDALVVTA